VDDYGNVRLDSRKAREAMDKAGLKVMSRFDAYDTLETREDLEMLFTVLSSVRDAGGRHAVFTPFSVPCNIDFETMAEEDYARYRSELLPETFAKLESLDGASYKGAWELWQEGISRGIFVPQFHGREHFNLKVFEDKLAERDDELLTALLNRSYTSLTRPGYHHIGYTSAFAFWDFEENQRFDEILEDGLNAFEKAFGFRSVHFNPPAGNEHSVIHGFARKYGVLYMDDRLMKKEHQGQGKYRTKICYTGKKNKWDQLYMVRNVLFEPTEFDEVDSVNLAMKQIEAAFRWNRPAIVSAHRVNFCGHIDPRNREKGLTALGQLLKRITEKWPDVEFMSSDQLGELMAQGN
jgi:hypothetical protein